jgi:hypothetical protein
MCSEVYVPEVVRALALRGAEQCAVKQGLLGPQWQRPEHYDLIHPPPQREAAE